MKSFKHFFSNNQRYTRNLIFLFGGVAFLLTLWVGLIIRNVDKATTISHYQQEAIKIIQMIGNEFSRNEYILLSLNTLFSSSENVSRDEFTTVVNHYLKYESHIQFLAFLPRVPHAQRRPMEIKARQNGLETFQFLTFEPNNHQIRQQVKDEYFPIYFIEPYNENSRLIGVDLSDNKDFSLQLNNARDLNTITTLINPEISRSLWNHPIYFLLSPLYVPETVNFTVEGRRENLYGYLIAGFQLKSVFTDPVLKSGLSDIYVRFSSQQDQTSLTVHSTFPKTILQNPKFNSDPWYYANSIQTGNAQLNIEILPAPFSPLRTINKRAWWLVIITWILIACTMLIFLFMIRQNTIIQSQVEARTAELKMLLNNVALQIWYLKDPATYGKVNAAHALFFNHKPEDLENQPISKIFPKLIAEKVILDNIKLFQTAQQRIYRQWTPNGKQEKRLLDITQTPHLNAKQQVEYIICTATDITDKYQTEQRLQDNQVFLQTIFNSIQDALFIWEFNSGVIIDCNPAATRIFQYSHDDLLMQTMDYLFKEPKKFESIFKSIDLQSLKAGHTLHIEHSSTNQAKQHLICEHVIHFLQEEDGETIMLLSAIRDITKKKSIEQEIAQSQKLSSIGQLAAGIAHEINTPIQFIGDNLRFLSDGFEDLSHFTNSIALEQTHEKQSLPNECLPFIKQQLADLDWGYLETEIPKAIEQALDGVKRVRTIVMAMKEFAHPEAYDKKSCVDINRIIQNTVIVAKNEWKYLADLKQDLEPGLLQAECYPDEIGQVILNLIINAAHAIESIKGTFPEGKGLITIKSRKTENSIILSVADNGSGIPDDIKEKIFDPFFTTKEVGKGTGQGLSLARTSIVQKHQGTLQVESTPGQGTEFTIRLPIVCQKPIETISEI